MAFKPIEYPYGALDAFLAQQTGTPLQKTSLVWDKRCLVPEHARAGDPDKILREHLPTAVNEWLDRLRVCKRDPSFKPRLSNLRLSETEATVWRDAGGNRLTRIHRIDLTTGATAILQELPMPEEVDATREDRRATTLP